MQEQYSFTLQDSATAVGLRCGQEPRLVYFSPAGGMCLVLLLYVG
jgi:hypothetical protein